MKLTIVYDNTAYRKDLQADWGFAALVEAHGRTILFDTGASGLICATHCTIHKRDIRRLYPERFIEGGAGQVIAIDG